MKKYSVPSLLFGFNILHNHEVILNRLEEGPFFEVFTTFLPGFSVKCVLPLGWLHLGVVYIEEGAIFRLFQTCWKLSSYMTGLNTCVRKLCELDALVFQITNWLMHKYYRRLCYRGNSSYFLSRLKATEYLDY